MHQAISRSALCAVGVVLNQLGLGARVACALVGRGFMRTLSAEVIACEACNKTLYRASDLLRALEVILTSPSIHEGWAALILPNNVRRGIQLLASEFKREPRALEAQLAVPSSCIRLGFTSDPFWCCGLWELTAPERPM